MAEPYSYFVLGKEETLARIQIGIEKLEKEVA